MSPPLLAGEGVRGEVTFPVADPNLAAFFDGLLAARWHGLCLFTSRYRWDALEEHLGRGAAVELHLPELTRAQAIMLMDNLPRLRHEPIATKLAVYRKVGGHPKSIELLEGWLASGKVTDLLADPSLDGMLAQQWADYFLRALLAQLTAAERDALARLCIFETALEQRGTHLRRNLPGVGGALARPLPAPARRRRGVHSAYRRPRIHDRTNDE